MKERPIIFSAPMVRAILAGAKTQTRRLVRPQPEDRCPLVKEWGYAFRNYAEAALGNVKMADGSWGRVQCPYGLPGDRLWVRETWGALPHMMGGVQPETLRYRADGEYQNERGTWRWRPSIHMPRWASRITLEITDVRLEQLQDISEADAIAEGCRPVRPEIVMDGTMARFGRSAVDEYRQLWQSIHSPESWSANPWVWVIEFKKLEQA